METKQVIVVRKDLNMRRGKEIAQGAHASLAVFFNMMDMEKNGKKYECTLIHTSEAMHEWMTGGFTKITVVVNSEQELLDVYNKACAAGLPCSLIRDAGKTEFAGVSTLTTVAVGPAFSGDVDKITGGLKLY